MTTTHSKLLLIFDDREFTSGEVRRLVGVRRFGEITFKRRPLHEHFRDALPAWAKEGLVRLETGADLAALRSTLETSSEDTIACVIAGRSGFPRADLLTQLIERLPYAEEDFTEKLYKPLIVFWRNAHDLVDQWAEFTSSPIHTWEQSWQHTQRLQSLQPVNLGNIREFLSFSSGSTAARHFNEVLIDAYYFKKSSTDKRKMQAECSFYRLAPSVCVHGLLRHSISKMKASGLHIKCNAITSPTPPFNGFMARSSQIPSSLLSSDYYSLFPIDPSSLVTRSTRPRWPKTCSSSNLKGG